MQTASGVIAPPQVIKAIAANLNAVDNFRYVGSILSDDATVDGDVSARPSKISCAFVRLSKRLWNYHGIRTDAKVAVYKAVILAALQYGCETWMLYRRQVN